MNILYIIKLYIILKYENDIIKQTLYQFFIYFYNMKKIF